MKKMMSKMVKKNKSKPQEITIQTWHRCGEYCATIYKEVRKGNWGKLVLVDNPTYKDGKCDKSDTLYEKSCVQISNYEEAKPNIHNLDEIVITDPEIKIQFNYPLNKEYMFTFQSATGFTREAILSHIVNTYKKIYQDEEDTASNQTFQYVAKCNSCEKQTEIVPTYTIDKSNDAPCSICLSMYVELDVICKLPCSHVFHKDCIHKWLDIKKTCPLCVSPCLDKCDKCLNGKISTEFVGKIVPIEIRQEMGQCLNRPSSNGIYGIWGHDLDDLVIERLKYDTVKKTLFMFIGS